ncbi:MAG: hypothetical protein IJ415_01165 [Clostridia bacterium]|nr:hypothetical protein [Clostridia bacterium]
MIKVYDDGSIYIGEMANGKRHGKGELYCLDNMFSGYKLVGTWQDDQLQGWAFEYSHGKIEQGYWDKGKKSGSFLREKSDGTASAIHYEYGKLVELLDVYSQDIDFQEKFGIKKYKDAIYLGDLLDGQPYGYGMLYFIKKQQIVSKQFGSYVIGHLIDAVDLNEVEEKTL